MGGQSNLLGKPETNSEEKALGGVELGWIEDFIIDDILELVGEECLGMGGVGSANGEISRRKG